MKQIKIRTGRGCNTHRLHQKEIAVIVLESLGDQDEDPSSTGIK